MFQRPIKLASNSSHIEPSVIAGIFECVPLYLITLNAPRDTEKAIPIYLYGCFRSKRKMRARLHPEPPSTVCEMKLWSSPSEKRTKSKLWKCIMTERSQNLPRQVMHPPRAHTEGKSQIRSTITNSQAISSRSESRESRTDQHKNMHL